MNEVESTPTASSAEGESPANGNIALIVGIVVGALLLMVCGILVVWIAIGVQFGGKIEQLFEAADTEIDDVDYQLQLSIHHCASQASGSGIPLRCTAASNASKS